MHEVLASPATGIGLEIRGIRRVFPGNVIALDGLDLTIAPGAFLAVLGPSGCGKSTLLRLIAGLDKPTGGSVHLTESVTRSGIAYVFQDAHLLPWRNVLRNVELPLELLGVGRRERAERATHMLDQVGLSDALRRYPSQLSGGMRMRVSLARALVTNPRLLLLDEPFAALDEITRQRLDEQLRQLWASRGMTVIFVTHSTAEAIFLADRAIVMTRRPGRILLDEPISLPPQRMAVLRSTPGFAQQTRAIYEALERGEA
jgi:NitT/TauT family transport system ATP-binding protein